MIRDVVLQSPAWQHLPTELAGELESFIEAWEERIARVDQLRTVLGEQRGQVGTSAMQLLKTLQLHEQVGVEMEALLIYTQLLVEIDGVNESFLELSFQAETLLAQIQEETEWIAAEIHEIEEALLSSWIRTSSELAKYERFFQLLHQGEEEESPMQVALQDLSADLERTHRQLVGHDIPFGSVSDASGVIYEVTMENYRTLLGSTDCAFREQVYTRVYDQLHQFRKTVAANLHVQFRKVLLGVDTTQAEALLHNVLSREGLTVAGYEAFLDIVHEHLNLNHQYYAGIARSLQREPMEPYDQYVTKNGAQTPKVPLEQAKQIIVDAFAFLGPSYQQDVRELLDRVVYSSELNNYTVNLYSERPVIVMQYNETLSSLIVLAHEVGHAVHLMRTNANQPYVYTEIQDVAAEMVALLHENIVLKYICAHPPQDSWRKHIEFLMLDNYRYNLFKATMLFEFERSLHQAVQEDQMLTASFLGDTYADLLKTYHGPAFVVDERISLDWMRVMHLYTPFYSAAYPLAFAMIEQVSHLLHEDPAMIERYVQLLESGSSLSLRELFALIGVELEEKSVYRSAFATFERLVKQYFVP